MEQQRHEPEPSLRRRRRAAAEHVVVVEPQLEVVVGVDDGDDAGRSLRDRRAASRRAPARPADRDAGRAARPRRAHRRRPAGAARAQAPPRPPGPRTRPPRRRGPATRRSRAAPRTLRAVRRRCRPTCWPPRARRGRPPRRSPRPPAAHSAGSTRPDASAAGPRVAAASATMRTTYSPRSVRIPTYPRSPVSRTKHQGRRRWRRPRSRARPPRPRPVAPRRAPGPPAPRRRQAQHDDQRHRGERVHRVVQHLREEARPQDLDAESERTGARCHQSQARRDRRRRPGQRDHGRPPPDGERCEPGNGARRRDHQVAGTHPDQGGQPETHRRHADDAAQGVQRIETPSPAADLAAGRERLSEHRQRGAEAHRGGEHRQRDRSDARRHAAGEQHALRAIAPEDGEDSGRPEGAERRTELQQAVACGRAAPSRAGRVRSPGRAPRSSRRAPSRPSGPSRPRTRPAARIHNNSSPSAAAPESVKQSPSTPLIPVRSPQP